MKKFFFMAATVSVALTSCVKNEIEVPQTGEDKVITFAEPVVGSLTRGYEVGNNYPIAGDYNFAVWAFYYPTTYTGFSNGAIYMKDVTVGYNTELASWEPTDVKYYWPKNGTLTFFGYSPATVNATYNEVGQIEFKDYEVSTERTKQVDLMFSEKTYNQYKYSGSNYSTDEVKGSGTTDQDAATTTDPYTGAHLVFKHALSSVLFNVKTNQDYSADQTVITLKSITLNNVLSKGTFTQNIADSDGAQTTTPDFQSGTAEDWTTTGAKADYQVFPNVSNDASEFNLNTTPYWPVNNANQENGPDFQDGLRGTDLMLIPQPLTDITVTIAYTIKSKDSSPINQTSTISLGNTAGHEWDWGYRYTYAITIGLEKITIEPYVTPWTEMSGTGTI